MTATQTLTLRPAVSAAPAAAFRRVTDALAGAGGGAAPIHREWI